MSAIECPLDCSSFLLSMARVRLSLSLPPLSSKPEPRADEKPATRSARAGSRPRSASRPASSASARTFLPGSTSASSVALFLSEGSRDADELEERVLQVLGVHELARLDRGDLGRHGPRLGLCVPPPCLSSRALLPDAEHLQGSTRCAASSAWSAARRSTTRRPRPRRPPRRRPLPASTRPTRCVPPFSLAVFLSPTSP